MITQIIRRKLRCVTDVPENFCVCGVYSMEAPELHKILPARKRCVTDVLCNWETNKPISKHIKEFGRQYASMHRKCLVQIHTD